MKIISIEYNLAKFTTHVNELYNTYHISLRWSVRDEAKNWYGSCCTHNGQPPSWKQSRLERVDDN